jgi:hypothetical protein
LQTTKQAVAHRVPTDTCQTDSIDPDLARIHAVWDRLPEPLKVGIMALVEAAVGE